MVVAEAFRGHPRFVDPNPRQFVQHRFARSRDSLKLCAFSPRKPYP